MTPASVQGPGRGGRREGWAELVLPGEIRRLCEQMAAAARGEAFVLQAGDCAAEAAGDTGPRVVTGVRTLLQAALVLTYGTQVPVTKICRLPAHLDDAPAPCGLPRTHAGSATMLNTVRAMTREASVADVRQVHQWNQQFVRTTAVGARYAELARRIDRVMRFMAAWDFDDTRLRTTAIFAGRQLPLHDYECPQLCREKDDDGVPWDLSSHFLWLGEGTRNMNGPHIAIAESVANPLGLEIGPDTLPEEAVECVRRLDPHFQPGRVTLMSGMGSGRVRDVLPPIVEKVTASGHQVVWQCDPMRENSPLFHVAAEVRGFFEVHRRLGTYPGGIRLDLTDENAAMELAFLIAETLRG
ncbi:3-deoxy-7-phosphoheptulonate synthase [Streptomyces sp. R28]|uniref:Phospho-2-dehydro-3-deoxyheptonate aldolase n=1 Tax=Streptomyces sp. R28 TaxID=3238628 RepID=A0AB39Q7J9_9ACTN